MNRDRQERYFYINTSTAIDLQVGLVQSTLSKTYIAAIGMLNVGLMIPQTNGLLETLINKISYLSMVGEALGLLYEKEPASTALKISKVLFAKGK